MIRFFHRYIFLIAAVAVLGGSTTVQAKGGGAGAGSRNKNADPSGGDAMDAPAAAGVNGGGGRSANGGGDNSVNGRGGNGDGIAFAGGVDGLTRWGNFLETRNQALRNYFMWKLGNAQVELVRSQAAMNWALADQYRAIAYETAHELQRVRLEQNDLDRIKLDMALKNNMITPLKLGVTDSNSFWALRYFFLHYIPIYVVKDAMSMAVAEMSADNFQARETTRGAPVRAFAGGNMGQFLKFIENSKVNLREWSDAHFAVLEMLNRLAVAAEEKIAEINRIQDQIRRGVLPLLYPNPYTNGGSYNGNSNGN